MHADGKNAVYFVKHHKMTIDVAFWN